MSVTSGIGLLGIRTVSVPARDQDRALDFYVNALGMEKRFEAAFGEGMRWIEVGVPGGDTSLALPPAREGSRFGVDTGVRLEVTDAVAAHSSLSQRGIDVDAEVMSLPGVPPMFSLRDPDGNTLYIVQKN